MDGNLMNMPGLFRPDCSDTGGCPDGKPPSESTDVAIALPHLERLAEPYRRYRLERAAKAILRGLLLPPDYLPHRLKPEAGYSPLLRWPGEFAIVRKV